MTTLRKFLQDYREIGIKDRSLTDDEILKVVKDWIKQWHNVWRENLQYEELFPSEVLPLIAKELGVQVISKQEGKQ